MFYHFGILDPWADHVGAYLFLNSIFSCCAIGISFLVQFRSNEFLTVNFSISDVEASNKSSLGVFSVSNVVRV